MSPLPPPTDTPFLPTGWSETRILAAAKEAGIDLPAACLPGVKVNLALLEERWATVSAALSTIAGEPSA